MNALFKQTIRVLNDLDRHRTIWLEPAAERVDLEPGQTLDVAFVGNKPGIPEIVESDEAISIYGWNGSDCIALKDGQVAGPQPTLSEIIYRHLDVAAQAVKSTGITLPDSVIESAQGMLDSTPEVNDESQEVACEIAGGLMFTLAECFTQSDAAAEMIWSIAVRTIRLRGRLAGGLPEVIRQSLWNNSPGYLAELTAKYSVSVLSESGEPDSAFTPPVEKKSRQSSG